MTRIFLIVPTLLLVLSSCGKAAEDREEMHRNARIFQDSLAKMIRTQLQEAEEPQATQPMQDTTRRAPQQAPNH